MCIGPPSRLRPGSSDLAHVELFENQGFLLGTLGFDMSPAAEPPETIMKRCSAIPQTLWDLKRTQILSRGSRRKLDGKNANNRSSDAERHKR